MNNLYIDYEQGIILGSEIKQKSQKLKTLLTKLNAIQEKLKGSFDKPEDIEYVRALITQTKIMYKLSDVVNETGNFLINVSDAYNEVAEINYNEDSQEEAK